MTFKVRGSRNPSKRRTFGNNSRNSSADSINFDRGESEPDFLRELEALRGRSCATVEKRYEILKARDRILQRLRKHESGGATKKLIVEGTCPDLCSEKERYRRIVQMAVNPFETGLSGEPNYKFFVTDYSRSAADQEQPLPHELRSPKALVASMDYILSSMCNKPVTTQWYDFVWSRTRAIRKEITQQKIISPEAVGILEKCCRIHIFAAHHFCESSAGDFDQQMNKENLVKSLQSLRHMYEDLAKRRILLDSEAEFRCYDVFLNLRDSNILQQVFKLRADVQATPEMQLAVDLFLAYNTSNYVRFFRMVMSSCSYLQACLLHRWFGELRADTLRTLGVSYSKKFPVATLTELLAFDNDQDTMDFVTDFGIVPSPEDPSCIVLSKDIYYEKPPLYVSQWINDKNALTLLEVLDGAVTTPNYEEPQEVTESFDCQGRYVNDPVLLEAILKLKVEVNHQKPTFPNSALRRIPELRKEPAKTIREEQKLTSLFSPSPVTPKPQTFGSFNFNSTTSKLPFASFKPKDIASVPAKQPQSFRFAFKPKEAAPSVPQLTPVAPKASPPKLRRPEEPKPEEFRRLSSIEEPHPVEERESSPEVLSSAERRDQEAQQEAFLGSMAGDMATKLCNHVAAVLFGKMATRIFEEEQEAERLKKEMDKIADRIQILRIAERVRRYGKLWKKKWMDARRPHIEDLPQIMPRISVNFNSTNMNYDLPWQDSRRFRRGSLIGHADADISFGRVFARIFKEERKVEVDEEELKEIAARILRTRINERVKRYALLWKKKWKDAQKAHVENLSQIMSRIPLNFPESIGMNFRLPMLERNLSCVLTPRPRREQPICETPLARPMPDRTTFSDSIRPTEAKRRRTSTEAS